MSGYDTTATVLMPSPSAVDRAIRFTYAQMMLNAVFAASTGGMFLIGFAIQLGADNVLLGVMASLPQFFVLCQFAAALLVERGYSRRRMTIGFGFVAPLCWLLIAALPCFGQTLNLRGRFTVLIGVIALVTLTTQFANNARASWLGELIPAERRGRFFGYCTMFAGIVGAAFAIIEGRCLDLIRSHGLLAFASLFFFGAAFGLASATMNIPQPDCPLPGGGKPLRLAPIVREMTRNRPYLTLAIVNAVIALAGIAGPFGPAYLLRDVGLSYFGLGLLNSISTAALLVTSPVWGKLVDRHGCRPVLIIGLLLLAPCALIWLGVPPRHPGRAYWLLPWTNFLTGVGSGALSVSISTLIYKVSRPEGRSVQFATYNAFVVLLGAPMPMIGGWLVSWLERSGYAIDLRLTFYLWGVFVLAAGIIAFQLQEPVSASVGALVFSYFPGRMAGLLGINLPAMTAPFSFLGRFQATPGTKRPPDQNSQPPP